MENWNCQNKKNQMLPCLKKKNFEKPEYLNYYDNCYTVCFMLEYL